jgi:hypothetical protein
VDDGLLDAQRIVLWSRRPSVRVRRVHALLEYGRQHDQAIVLGRGVGRPPAIANVPHVQVVAAERVKLVRINGGLPGMLLLPTVKQRTGPRSRGRVYRP